MRRLWEGLDYALALLGAAAWSSAAFLFASRLAAAPLAAALALGVLVTSLVALAGGFARESRLARLLAGSCPVCNAPVRGEHEHRRLGPDGQWRPPLTAWSCRSCGFQHAEAWACEHCLPADSA